MIVAAAGCLALAWWQWTRFESASGTFQNLGYALQWPAVRRVLRLRLLQVRPLRGGPARAEGHDAVTEIPAGLLPERPKPATQSEDDPALREYNAYLADLAKKDKEP